MKFASTEYETPRDEEKEQGRPDSGPNQDTSLVLPPYHGDVEISQLFHPSIVSSSTSSLCLFSVPDTDGNADGNMTRKTSPPEEEAEMK